MKTIPYRALALAASLIASGFLRAETPDPVEALRNLAAQRMQLIEEEYAVFTTAKPEIRQQALAAWREQHKARFEALREAMKQLADEQPPSKIPLIEEIVVPPKTPQTTVDLLVTHAELQNDRAELLNRLRHATKEERAAALIAFDEAHRAQYSTLAERAQTAAAELNRQQPVPDPPLLEIPRGADAALRDAITERNTFLRERFELEQRLRTVPEDQANDERRRWLEQQQVRRSDPSQSLQQNSSR